MNKLDRVRRQQLMRQAEGFLELATAVEGDIALDLADKKNLARMGMECLDQVSDTPSFHPQICFLRGQFFRAIYQYEVAIPYLKEALDGDEENIHIYLALGWCYKRTNKIELAIDALQSAAEFEPTNALIQYNLACYLALANRAHSAITHLSRAFDLDPKYRELVQDEADFDLIRSQPEFLALTSVNV